MRFRYPWASDTVSVADVQSMAADIDSGLVSTATMAANFSKAASVVVQRAAAQSITKATNTAISFDTATLNNGANSPQANGAWWAAGSPTRLTAPVGCVVLCCSSGGINFGSALGTGGVLQLTVGLNGGGNLQGNKFNPISTVSGQQWTSLLSLWKLNAGDFLEMKMLWTGTPAGPFNTDTTVAPMFSLMMVGLTSVA